MLKAVEVFKNAPPGLTVTVSLPALIRSGSSYPGSGYSPVPKSPFSEWKYTLYCGSTKLGVKVGMPIPRFTYVFGWISAAALFAMMTLALTSPSSFS